MGKAICLPTTVVLFGLMIIVGYAVSHSVVEVAETDWVEPVFVWVPSVLVWVPPSVCPQVVEKVRFAGYPTNL